MSAGAGAPASCLFCAIVAGSVPAEVLERTELGVAFADVAPAAPTHVLVIPSEHLDSAAALTPAHGPLLAELLGLAQRAARTAGVDATGYRIVCNVGPDGGQTVGHLHLHLLGGRRMTWPPG
jgi:histidine triad (HIT) family protein